MKKHFIAFFSVLVISGMAAGTVSAAQVDMSTDTWCKFFFYDVGFSSSDKYDFTVDVGYSLYVTDAYQVGDRFQVGDLGMTSLKEVDTNSYYSPWGDQDLAAGCLRLRLLQHG